jgi:tetratricopeptide (TPR) repeat protein
MKHLFIPAFCLASLLPLNMSGQVKMEETVMSIPTYVQEAPNPMPRFYEGRSHQGVQRRIYPYPYDDGLTTNKQNRDYPVIRLENEYIEMAIMPAMGGRVYYANDKTNGYNYLYHNHVVKPSLIGMTGNWVSGSLAWGYPHHHGPHTVEAMDWKTEERPDGSKTVWINSTDRLLRVNILVGYTVYPNSSLLEMSIRPGNRTPLSNSFLFWANPAVHADSAYQVIFPPSVQYVTHHGKREMATWPIADGWFNNYDFTGEDVSWWKNTHVPSSFFSWDPKEDYFGGYDHRLKAGIAWTGNHHIMPGMKYWADGNNANGLKTNEGLTDSDGRYIELMAGFYTDNQPDYSWMQPYETKTGAMIWFPIRELDGLKYANRNGALNYFLDGQALDIRLNTTSPHRNARLAVRAGGKEIFTKNLNISPAEPQKALAQVPAGTEEDGLEIQLLDAGGRILLEYRPGEHHPPAYGKPEPLKPFPKPADVKTVEELYLIGARLNQFYNAQDPAPYYAEALQRDPEDYRTNTQLGILAIKSHNWELAEKHLRTAVQRITSHYTRPKDGEALYYLALALRALGRTEEAYDFFYQASWTYPFKAASYYQLAEIDCERGEYATALEHLNSSIPNNGDNIRALNLKAAVLRKTGDLKGARQLLEEILEKSVINHWALNELCLVDTQLGNPGGAAGEAAELTRIMRDAVQPYLELAAEYMQAGFFREAASLLARPEQKGETYPLLYYYLGYLEEKSGDSTKALHYYRKAGAMPHNYCYPFRSEEVFILRAAIKANPPDAMAHYYLGNLLYEHQPQEAIKEWEQSRSLNPAFYITHRNLGMAYRDIQKDYPKALLSMQQAVACSKDDPRLLFEIDVLNELNRVSPKEKYGLLKKNLKTAEKRPETLLRFVTRAVEYGKYDEALKTMQTHAIAESEGAREMQNNYLNIYTLKAMSLLKQNKTDEALKNINLALAYPIGLYGRARYAQLDYVAGLIYLKKGDAQQANEHFMKAAAANTERGSDAEYDFYKGQALVQLKRTEEARQLFTRMLQNIRDDNSAFYGQFEGGAAADTQRAANHWLAGLAHEGLGDKAKAIAEYQETLRINPGHIWSRIHLDAIR